MRNPLIMHINYCEQGQTVDETCRKAAAWGFDGIEFRRVSTALKYESQEKYLDDIAAASSRHGLSHVIFGYPTADLMQSNAGKREKETDDAIKFFSAALKRMPLTVVNAFSGPLTRPDIPYGEYDRHGSFMASDEHWSQAAEGFKILGKFASGNGFAFAFETHMGYLHDTPQAAKKLTDMIGCPAVGVNLDYGNAVYFKKENILPLADTIRHLGKSLLYTHLKNSVNVPGVDKRMPTALSQGEINHREYIKVLKETGYKGPLCVEAPRPGDREWFAAEDLHYIKSVISEVTLAG